MELNHINSMFQKNQKCATRKFLELDCSSKKSFSASLKNLFVHVEFWNKRIELSS